MEETKTNEEVVTEPAVVEVPVPVAEAETVAVEVPVTEEVAETVPEVPAE